MTIITIENKEQNKLSLDIYTVYKVLGSLPTPATNVKSIIRSLYHHEHYKTPDVIMILKYVK